MPGMYNHTAFTNIFHLTHLVKKKVKTGSIKFSHFKNKKILCLENICFNIKKSSISMKIHICYHKTRYI